MGSICSCFVIISTADCFITRHLTIRLDTMLKAEELPTCVTDLHTSLTDVDTESFTHADKRID
jgi:hypothetical protein